MDMTKDDWKELERLFMLHVHTKISEDDDKKLEILLQKTTEVDEHPESWDWPCLCQLCASYGD